MYYFTLMYCQARVSKRSLSNEFMQTDMAATGAQTINYLYDKDNDPLSAFDWWILKTCGDTSLVPDELKEVFDVLVQVVDGISYKEPKKLKKGSGKKGDDAGSNL